MSTLIQQYTSTEQQLKTLKDRLEQLQNDPRLKLELEFKEKLESLMREFDKNSFDVLKLLDPGAKVTTEERARKKRKLKVYKNAYTGEILETRGANHNTLKAWKEEHGPEAVESWLVSEVD